MSRETERKLRYAQSDLEDADALREEEMDPAIYSGEMWSSSRLRRRYQVKCETARTQTGEIDEKLEQSIEHMVELGSPGAAATLLNEKSDEYGVKN